MSDEQPSIPEQLTAMQRAEQLDPDIAMAVRQGNKAVIDAVNTGASTNAQVVDILIRSGQVTNLPVGVQEMVKETVDQREAQREAENRNARRLAESVIGAALFMTEPAAGATVPPPDGSSSAKYRQAYSGYQNNYQEMNSLQYEMNDIRFMSYASWSMASETERIETADKVYKATETVNAKADEQWTGLVSELDGKLASGTISKAEYDKIIGMQELAYIARDEQGVITPEARAANEKLVNEKLDALPAALRTDAERALVAARVKVDNAYDMSHAAQAQQNLAKGNADAAQPAVVAGAAGVSTNADRLNALEASKLMCMAPHAMGLGPKPEDVAPEAAAAPATPKAAEKAEKDRTIKADALAPALAAFVAAPEVEAAPAAPTPAPTPVVAQPSRPSPTAPAGGGM